MPPQPNSRKLLLNSSALRKGRLESHEEDDGLYNVRRVQTGGAVPPPETPTTRMRLRSMARREARASSVQDSPESSSAPSVSEFDASEKSRGFFGRSMIIFTCLVFGIGGYLAYHPQSLPLFRSLNIPRVPLDRAESGASLSKVTPELRNAESEMIDLSANLQMEYHKLQNQYEQSVHQLKQLNEKVQSMELMRKFEADVHSQQEADHLRALNRQIEMLTAELRDLRSKYGEIHENLASSTFRNAKLEAEIAERLEQIKHEVESQGDANRALSQHTTNAAAEPAKPLAPNLATLQNGARIVKSFTTTGMADEEHWTLWFGKTAASFFPNGRYQPLMGVQTHYADVVLDEKDIRGPGDCFCVRGLEANVTFDLGFAIYASKVGIEHAPRQLTTHAERAPSKVSVYALRHELDENANHVAKLELGSRNADTLVTSFTFDYPEERTHYETIRDIRAQRFRFQVQGRQGSDAVCLYRVVIIGNVSE